MTGDVTSRAQRRAAEAHNRAIEAEARAAELATGVRIPADEAVARSRTHLVRAAQLAEEGYAHAAEAERAAAEAHDAMARSLEAQAESHPDDSVPLRVRAAEHRASAAKRREGAEFDERRLRELRGSRPAGEHGAQAAG